MILPTEFLALLRERGVAFFTGVPDSLLKDFCACVSAEIPAHAHVIAANEGNAVALAVGHYLAAGTPALVYMQNAGEGNVVNPIVSLADPKVYGIPLLFLIGWRGEPGVHDEPQHVKQGEITCTLLETIGVPFEILPHTSDDVRACLDRAFHVMQSEGKPYAIVVRKGTFAPYPIHDSPSLPYEMIREEAVQCIIDSLSDDAVVVSTTGMTSRELFEYREAKGHSHGRDFLTVGSMGHSSSIALGIARAQPNRTVYCLDGDGAFIMHMGSLAVIGAQKPSNLKHIVINNGAHDSVGGQPTAGFAIDIPEIARSCGYRSAWRVESRSQLITVLAMMRHASGPCMLEVRVRRGARANLGRPTTTPQQNKEAFMDFLRHG